MKKLTVASVWGALLGCSAASVVAPEQIRLALTGNPTEMLIFWATSNVSTPQTYSPTVWFGTSPSTPSSVSGTTSNYTAYNIASPFLHHGVAAGLTENTMYYYRVGDVNNGVSALFNFTTAPAVGDVSAYPVKFLAYADMGIEYSQPTANLTAALVSQGDVDLMLHIGDISYADDRAKINNGSWYDGIVSQFFNEVQPSSQQVPYMISSGNHEAILNFTAYKMRVSPTMPTLQSNGSDFWYSFNYGPVHFLAFDSDQDYIVGSPQYDWMQRDLAAVDRSVTPWVVAYNHFPLQCSNDFWCPQSGPLRDTFEPLFNAPETKVDIFIAGHVHASEIVYPMIDNKVIQTNFNNITATFNMLVGFPGDMEVCCNTWTEPKPAFSYWRASDVAASGGFFGFSQFAIVNYTHAHMKVWDSVNATVVKDLWISVDRSGL